MAVKFYRVEATRTFTQSTVVIVQADDQMSPREFHAKVSAFAETLLPEPQMAEGMADEGVSTNVIRVESEPSAGWPVDMVIDRWSLTYDEDNGWY